jgi:DNA-binding transcriptional MocR family regulator
MQSDEAAGWLLPLTGEGPVYLRIAAAIERAVMTEQLRPGERLPSHRALCRMLGVDLTTVTRGYAEARRRHLIDGVLGRGSFVAARSGQAGPTLDLGMNIPPPPRGLRLDVLIREGLDAVLKRTDADLLMAYQREAGSRSDRAAGAQWLSPYLGPMPPERLLVSGGAQHALSALLMMLARPGDTVLCDGLTYPGFLAVARGLDLQVRAVAGDARGMRPDRLAAMARQHGARLIYLQPSMQNPSTLTMDGARRADIARLAQKAGLTIIEDDPYRLLATDMPPPLAALAPGNCWHIATLSKCLTPGLRTAFVVAPDAGAGERMARALHALTLMAPPLTTALAARWISDGTAAAILRGVREAARERQSLARSILPGAAAHPEGLHLWLALPKQLDRESLAQSARQHGVGLMPSDAFSAGPRPPDGVRISLGAVADGARLQHALSVIAALLERGEPVSPLRPPAFSAGAC